MLWHAADVFKWIDAKVKHAARQSGQADATGVATRNFAVHGPSADPSLRAQTGSPGAVYLIERRRTDKQSVQLNFKFPQSGHMEIGSG